MADDYASHYAILAAAVAKVCGSVLELGAGEGSTPMLHYMAKEMKCFLRTCDSDLVWLERFRGYAGPNHVLSHVTDWHQWMREEGNLANWGVVFVDNAPGHLRVPLIRWLQGRAKYIIAHDSERDWATGANYGYEHVKPEFKYVSEFRRWRPYTLILSDDAPFELEECDRKWTPSPEQMAVYRKEGIKE